MDENTRWQKLAAEFLGTAFLVFVGVGSVPALLIVDDANGSTFSGSDLGIISLAFATVVIVTVYVFGYISGNHINPAVTLGLAATGKFPWAQVPTYLAAQVLGAVAGAFAIVGVLGTKASDVGLGVASYGDAIPWYQAFFAEFIGTFLLVFAVFGVIYRKAAPGWAGLAIGMMVFAAIIPVAPTTGASINPARTTGPMLVQQVLGGHVSWEQWPVYVVAELLAGVAAALSFGLIAHTAQDNAAESAVENAADTRPAEVLAPAVPSEV
jgi:glycerol uptake facilitator protein